MKTLVVHPDDRSTDFLRPVYSGLKNHTLITGNTDQLSLRQLIAAHDRVILLGHGTENGLLAVGQFICHGSHIIDDSMAPLLREKKDLVCIWCHADLYVKRHQLNTGFHTGMFISEMIEALYYLPEEELDYVTDAHVESSNRLFSGLFGQYIEDDSGERLTKTTSGYNLCDNPVVRYNKARLFSVGS